jgi:hypothetical protein
MPRKRPGLLYQMRLTLLRSTPSSGHCLSCEAAECTVHCLRLRSTRYVVPLLSAVYDHTPRPSLLAVLNMIIDVAIALSCG